MGRRNLKHERREQILVAFERCVAEHGLAGTTLERVAEYAELGRAAIRHNVGNRDALIRAALERIVSGHERALDALSDALPSTGRVDALLKYLFLPGRFSGEADAEDAVLDELFALRHRDEEIRKRLNAVYEHFEATIVRELRRDHPEASRSECSRVAYVIMSFGFGHSTFSGLGVGAKRGRACLRYARDLVATLSAP